MKVLVIGSGAREHALVWKLKQDEPGVSLFIAPGNAGTVELGENLAFKVTDVKGISNWAEKNKPDVTIVGPEAPLCAGIVDELQALDQYAFGPDKNAARLEGSKVLSKALLKKYGLPTARGESFDEIAKARQFSAKLGFPQVIKADGLAAGKGVIIAPDAAAANRALDQIMAEQIFGAAGSQVVIEEFLEGQEVSVQVVTDGVSYRYFPMTQDHKRIGDGDTGLNTGGMGAYAPMQMVDAAMEKVISDTILTPFFAGLKKEGIDYRGILYAGLMLTAKGPMVIEFNVRFGDPEAQVLMHLLQTPLLEVVHAVKERSLGKLTVKFRHRAVMAVVMAAANYPEKPRTGDVIDGLDQFDPGDRKQVVFHAGTKLVSGKTVTDGGRVLTVTATAATLPEATQSAYAGVKKIRFAGAQYRSDIGAKAQAT
jgi:phosphoribosylamine---glycine ligase